MLVWQLGRQLQDRINQIEQLIRDIEQMSDENARQQRRCETYLCARVFSSGLKTSRAIFRASDSTRLS